MAATEKGSGSHADDSFLDGGGELGALIRAFDWTRTPLGPPSGWPRSLKTAVRIMLTSRQPIWLGWGPELTYLYNDPYKSIIGGKHPHALGRPFSEVWREIWDVVGPMADTVMTRDEGTYVEARLLIMERHGYQEETYYTFSYSPIPGDDGRPGGLICANTDDTRRVIGERQLALLSELGAKTGSARTKTEACALAMEALATNSRDAPFALIFVADADANLPLCAASSPGASALGDAATWDCRAVMRTNEIRVVSLDRTRGCVPSGAWAHPPTEAAVLPIEASGGAGCAGALVVGLNPFRKFDDSYRDFLALVARQLAAAIANAEAYEEEKKRAEALAELDRAKTAFFSNVSHEFRTPLTLMLGTVDDMLSRPEDGVPTEDRGLLHVVHRNGQRLLRLVNTLLDFARIEAGRTQAVYEPVDLASVTADLASNFRSACERAGIRLVVDCASLADAAYVDREMWEKIVLNLVSNAFKFTLEGEIAVRVRDSGSAFELTVSDTGTGIPADALPRMFRRFQRVEGARGRSYEGSGIGLALVQELIKLHGGSITVESTLGKGTTFTVSIPKGSAHLPADRVKALPVAAVPTTMTRAETYVEEALGWLPSAQTTSATPPRSGKRVLLADDNLDMREYARRLLSEQYDVEAVADGEQALAAIRANPPDLIVSDVMMPKLDGFGLIQALRADVRLQHIPVILLSARAGEEARIEGLNKGADDYLVKPFGSRELLVRVATMLRTVESHRRANEARAQFEILLNRAPVGVYLVDEDFRIAAVNPVALPVFGDIADPVGRPLEDVIRVMWPKHYADEILASFRRTLETGESYVASERIEHRLDRGGTEIYDWEVHRIPLPGNRRGVVCYFHDISRLVLAREALRESDRRKDEFLATLSHELRNPLAPLLNGLQLLRMKSGGDDATAPIFEMMDRQVSHLVRLVDDLLEVSRISRGTLELRKEHIELADVVRNAIDTSNPLIRSGEHQLTVSLPAEPLWIDGDPVRLAQILANLLNNSATYTPRGGSISLRAERSGDAVSIAVRDNGAGIAADDLPRVFEMFARGGPTSTRHPGGLGIGLSLAQRLAQMHGGGIGARSEGAGRGSEFTVRLPLAPVQAEVPRIVRSADLNLARRRILVVDDNTDAADSLAMILEFLGADVRVARDGKEALALLPEYEPRVILLDIGMPGMDGYEVARRIRAHSKGSPRTLVALTGWGQEKDRQRVREAGFDHHLVKPAEMAALQALLQSIDDDPRAP